MTERHSPGRIRAAVLDRRRVMFSGFCAFAAYSVFPAPGHAQPERPGGRGSGGGRQGGARPICESNAPIIVRLTVDGRKVWEAPPEVVIRLPGATTATAGPRAGLGQIALSDLVPDGAAAGVAVLKSCDGRAKNVNLQRLRQPTQPDLLLMITPRGFLKLAEIREDSRERTLLRDVRDIAVRR